MEPAAQSVGVLTRLERRDGHEILQRLAGDVRQQVAPAIAHSLDNPQSANKHRIDQLQLSICVAMTLPGRISDLPQS